MSQTTENSGTSEIRHNWQAHEVKALFDMPFNDLMFKAQVTHRENFNPNEVQVSTLLSIKTGACPEDCKYCSQSSRYKTNVDKEGLMEIQKVLEWGLVGVTPKLATCQWLLKWLKA